MLSVMDGVNVMRMVEAVCTQLIEFDTYREVSIMETCVRKDSPMIAYEQRKRLCKDLFEQEAVKQFEELHQNDSYYMLANSSKINIIKLNALSPSLFEVVASQIAHSLFPENFAKYKFIVTMEYQQNAEVMAGYLLPEAVKLNPECAGGKLEGVENVYATAFFLGLEVDSHLCVQYSSANYLFVDDFSHAFHELDAEHKALVEVYRDHKILSPEKGTLFPTSFIDDKCGEWLGRECDIDRLKSAYERISNISKEHIANIFDSAIGALQSIECSDTCSYTEHYSYMREVQDMLGHNQAAISEFLS